MPALIDTNRMIWPIGPPGLNYVADARGAQRDILRKLPER